MTGFNYQPFFCEENVWWWAKQQGSAPERFVAFVSNLSRSCEMWSQRPAPEGTAVVWDYHVVGVERGVAARIWDFDSRLAAPASAHQWLRASFRPDVPAPFAPLFRVVASVEFLRHFASDRRHMRDEQGGWHAEPPAWPDIVAPSGAIHTLDAFLDMANTSMPGAVMDIAGFGSWLESRSVASGS